jgi:hypothetical protein
MTMNDSPQAAWKRVACDGLRERLAHGGYFMVDKSRAAEPWRPDHAPTCTPMDVWRFQQEKLVGTIADARFEIVAIVESTTSVVVEGPTLVSLQARRPSATTPGRRG